MSIPAAVSSAAPAHHRPAEDYYFRTTDKTMYTPYDSIRPIPQPPGFSNSTGPATPITPVSFNSRKTDGWEYQEFVPANKKKAEPEKFVPAKVIPAKNDPFYFGDPEEEVIDVSLLTDPAPAPKMPQPSPFENSASFTVQKIPKEKPEEKPYKSEYIIGNNKKGQRTDDSDEDYNANCEYIIAEKNTGSGRFGKRGRVEKKERIVESDEDGAEITTYE
jgi:hypothetical protein